jgi:hypothetical protein
MGPKRPGRETVIRSVAVKLRSGHSPSRQRWARLTTPRSVRLLGNETPATRSPAADAAVPAAWTTTSGAHGTSRFGKREAASAAQVSSSRYAARPPGGWRARGPRWVWASSRIGGREAVWVGGECSSVDRDGGTGGPPGVIAEQERDEKRRPRRDVRAGPDGARAVWKPGLHGGRFRCRRGRVR